LWRPSSIPFLVHQPSFWSASLINLLKGQSEKVYALRRISAAQMATLAGQSHEADWAEKERFTASLQDAKTGSGRFPRISSVAIFMTSLREEGGFVSGLDNGRT
jgi:hypothetical protein